MIFAANRIAAALRTGILFAAATPFMASAALVVNTTNDIDALTGALLAADSGISITGAGLPFGGSDQQGVYSGFNLTPNDGTSPSLSMQDGVVLTTGGNANVPLENTTNNFSTEVNGPGIDPLSVLSGENTFDGNMLRFAFSVEPGLNAVSMQFVFATDEFPTQSVTDIFGFFVDGINYAQFPSGELISNTPGNPTNFISNPVGGGLYDIEWNGLTQVFTVTGLLNTALTEHHLEIAIADTVDTIYDSAVYISGLKATTSSSGGIGNEVPEPGSMLLLGLGLLGLAAMRKRAV